MPVRHEANGASLWGNRTAARPARAFRSIAWDGPNSPIRLVRILANLNAKT